jgi:hypothetical protein
VISVQYIITENWWGREEYLPLVAGRLYLCDDRFTTFVLVGGGTKVYKGRVVVYIISAWEVGTDIQAYACVV